MDQEQQVQETDESTGDTTGAATSNSGQPSEISFTPEQQSAIDKLIGDRLKRAKSQWADDQEKAKAKQQQEAEAKRLEEQQEYKELLELERKKAAELEPLAGKIETLAQQLEAYDKTVLELLNAKIEALGEAAKTAVDNLPGEPGTLAKLDWLTANEALFTPQQQPVKHGTPPRQPTRQPATQTNNQEAQPYAPLVRF